MVRIFREDLHPPFDGTKAEFEDLIYEYKKEVDQWRKSRPVPKYDIINDLLNYGIRNDFELLSKRDYIKGRRV